MPLAAPVMAMTLPSREVMMNVELQALVSQEQGIGAGFRSARLDFNLQQSSDVVWDGCIESMTFRFYRQRRR